MLDRGVVDEWRVEDAEAKAEKRQKKAYEAKLKKSLKKRGKTKKVEKEKPDVAASQLRGWEEFDVDGLLR